MRKRNEVDLGVLNAYWMWRDDLITDETLKEALDKFKDFEKAEEKGTVCVNCGYPEKDHPVEVFKTGSSQSYEMKCKKFKPEDKNGK